MLLILSVGGGSVSEEWRDPVRVNVCDWRRVILCVLFFLRFFFFEMEVGGGGVFDVLWIPFETEALNADLQFLP